MYQEKSDRRLVHEDEKIDEGNNNKINEGKI